MESEIGAVEDAFESVAPEAAALLEGYRRGIAWTVGRGASVLTGRKRAYRYEERTKKVQDEGVREADRVLEEREG